MRKLVQTKQQTKMETLDQGFLRVDQADQVTRTAFIRKTYEHVAGAVLAFIGVEALLLNIPGIEKMVVLMTSGYAWLIVLGLFMFATNYAEKLALSSHDKQQQYIGLGLYIVAEAVIFVPLMYIAMMYSSPSVINQAAVITLALFTGLSAVVITTGKDFSFLRSAITIGSIIALGLIVAGILFGFNMGLWFSVGMVVLAAGSILYQTSNMVHKYSTDQHVAAALGLFASLMLLFWYIIQILMSRD